MLPPIDVDSKRRRAAARLTSFAAALDNMAIRTESQSEFRTSSGAPAPGNSSSGVGRLVALWYGGLAVAALCLHLAIGTNSTVLASVLAATAVVIPILLLTHTMSSYRAAFDSRVLVPVIGPVIIVVLLCEYVGIGKRLGELHSADLIPSNLLMVSDVRWTHGGGARPSRLSGRVYNRSGRELVGMSIEAVLFGGSEELSSATAETDLDVGPGEHGSFNVDTSDFATAGLAQLPCVRMDDDLAPVVNNPGGTLECVYRVTGTRGEDVVF
jgi:hypothetical protein